MGINYTQEFPRSGTAEDIEAMSILWLNKSYGLG